VSHAGAGAFLPLALSWWAMTALTMLPLTWPWLRALHRISRAERSAALSPALPPAFAAGYLAVWLGFGAGAAALQLLVASWAVPEPELRSALLAAAGLYQLTPAKAACLERCRSPFAAVLARWPLSAPGALRLGGEHGLFCLACCWALMLLGLAAGVAGWPWMAALTLLVAAEKLTPAGPRLARWSGAGLLGLALLAAAGRF
jgi:predicted metal-binding membrane protein